MARAASYRFAVAVAVGAALMLLWLMGAVGIVGIEGDPADLMYVAVLGVGLVGAIIARLRPHGMARAMLVMAGAMVLVGVIAIVLGRHEAPYSSVPEILGLSGMFAAMFATSAWLFRRAADGRPTTGP